MIFYLKGKNKVKIQKGALNKVTSHTEIELKVNFFSEDKEG